MVVEVNGFTMMGLNNNIGFLGAGNISQSIIAGLMYAKAISPQNIFVSNRTEGKLQKVAAEFGVNVVKNNEELFTQCQTIIVGVKPVDLTETLEPLSNCLEDYHYLVSLAAGVPLEKLHKIMRHDYWARVMPTIGARTGSSVSGLITDSDDETFTSRVEALFAHVGSVYRCDAEEQFDALMVATSSGIGFVIELMLYWQEWLEEHGFSAEEAKQATIKTFFAASTTALSTNLKESNLSFTDLINKVASKKGVTQAGLDSMRELETERTLRMSFDKALLRTQQIVKSQK